MSYLEIMQALEQGQKVYWINSAYRVFLENGKLYEINIYITDPCVACRNHNTTIVLLNIKQGLIQC